MITRKPKQFRIAYDSGVSGEFCDPITGKPWYTLKWPTIKSSMARLAVDANEPLMLIDCKTNNCITVSPEGKWS